MTQKDFFQYTAHPENLDGHTIPFLEKLMDEYPYFQIGRMLYLKNIHNENHIEYDKHLNTVSAYSPGGKALYQLIKKKVKTVPDDAVSETVQDAPKAIPIIRPEETIVLPKAKAENTKDTFDELELLQNEMLNEALRTSLTIEQEEEFQQEIEVKNTNENLTTESSYSFNDWLKIIGKQPLASTANTELLPSVQKPYKKEIINKFILTEIDKKPKKAKAEFYSADAMAKRSVQDNEEIVSETLASIYFKQGNLPKALRAYEILLSRHPKKVHIFAPLLEKIKKLIEEQKTK